MKRFVGLFALSLAAAVGAAGAASADSAFRCESGRLVSTGDHMYDVRNKCGDPDMITQRADKRRVSHKVVRWVRGAAEEIEEEREIDVMIDEWIYDFGPERFIRIVAFENNKVTCVNTGNYGKKRD